TPLFGVVLLPGGIQGEHLRQLVLRSRIQQDSVNPILGQELRRAVAIAYRQIIVDLLQRKHFHARIDEHALVWKIPNQVTRITELGEQASAGLRTKEFRRANGSVQCEQWWRGWGEHVTQEALRQR